METERKEKKKQREKERKERLKAEGKLLTTKQKLEQARAQAMLESLRAQGVELPEAGAKKARPGTRVRPNKKNQQAANQTPSDEKDEAKLGETALHDGEKQDTDMAVDTAEEVIEKIKDSWDASSSEDESSEVAEPKAAVTAVKSQQNTSNKSAQSTKQGAPKKSSTPEDTESEATDDSDEESESESEDESEEDTKTDAEKKKEKAWERIMVRIKCSLYNINWAINIFILYFIR